MSTIEKETLKARKIDRQTVYCWVWKKITEIWWSIVWTWRNR